MEAVTKASQIRALHAKGLSSREIALEVYGEVTESRKAYVRIVVGQRKGGQSAADVRYLAKPDKYRQRLDAQSRWCTTKYHGDPEYRRKKLDWYKERYASDPLYRLQQRKRSKLSYLRRKVARKELPASSESAL